MSTVTRHKVLSARNRQDIRRYDTKIVPQTVSTGLSTVIGSDGTTQWGPHNLAPESDAIVGWSGTLTSNSTPFSVAAFDGGNYGLTANSVAGTTNFSALYTANDTSVSLFVDVKRGNFDTGNACYTYGFYNATLGADICYITVNYLTGAVALTGPQAGTSTAYTTTLSNGWFRIGIKVVAGINPGNNFYTYLGGTGGATSAGFYWHMARVHVYNGAFQPYLSSSVPNRLSYSNDFTNAAWTKQNVTPYEKLAVTANGTPMTLLVENTTNGGHYVLSNAIAGTGFAQLQYKVKPAGRTRVGLRSESPKAQIGSVFDLIGNGAVISGPGSITFDPSDGTYLCTANATGVGNGTSGYHLIEFYNSSNSASYAGDGVSGAYVCNAQLAPAAQNAAAIPYAYNPTTAPAIGAFYGPHIDHDVSTISGIGPNLVTNGSGLVNTTGWSAGNSTLASVGGALQVTGGAGGNGYASQAINSLVVGKAYYLSYLPTFGTETNGLCWVGTSLGGNQTATDTFTVAGRARSVLFVATATTHYLRLGQNNPTPELTILFNNITIQEAFAGAIAGYGGEQVINGSFDVDANWIKPTGFAISGSTLNYDGTGGQYSKSYQNFTLVPNTTYLITGNLKTLSSSNISLLLALASLGATQQSYLISATGTFSFYWLATASALCIAVQVNSATQTFSIDDLSVKQVTYATKGQLIEQATTQIAAQPDDLSAAPWSGTVAVTSDNTRFRGRKFWKCLKTSVAGSESRSMTCAGGVTTGYYTHGIAFLAATSKQVDFGLLGGTSTWGVNGDTVCSIDSGPGTLAQMVGGLWRIIGLSSNVPTVVTMTRNFLVSETIGVFIYPDTSSSTTIGNGVYVQCDNVEAGKVKTSTIPNPTSGTASRSADVCTVGADVLYQALPWLMDLNLIGSKSEDLGAWSPINSGTGVVPVVTSNDSAFVAPDGTYTADKVVFNVGSGTTASDYSMLYTGGLPTSAAAPYSSKFRVMGVAGTQVMFRHVAGSGYALVTCSGLGIWDDVPVRTELALGSSSDMTVGIHQGYFGTINATATVWIWGVKLNPGPIAQTYYPQSKKQATISIEGDLSYGATSGSAVLASLENTTSNRVMMYKPASTNQLLGFVPGSNATPGNISSNTAFKAALGFSASSAGVVLNGSAESAISAPTFTAMPNILKVGNDAGGNAASSMHFKSLRLFSQNLTSTVKKYLTS